VLQFSTRLQYSMEVGNMENSTIPPELKDMNTGLQDMNVNHPSEPFKSPTLSRQGEIQETKQKEHRPIGEPACLRGATVVEDAGHWEDLVDEKKQRCASNGRNENKRVGISLSTGTASQKRRKFPRRNSIFIHRDKMKEFKDTFIDSLRDDDFHESSPELFISPESFASCDVRDRAFAGTNYKALETRKRQNLFHGDFNASWSSPDDTRRFMEALSMEPDYSGKTATTDCSTTATQSSSSDWRVEDTSFTSLPDETNDDSVSLEHF